MREFGLSLVFVAMTFLAWGLYGPTLHQGQHAMIAEEGDPPSSIRSMICVGLAYFAIAVIVPTALLVVRGEKGRWTRAGAIWALASGSVGAIGALGIILAFKFGGKAVYVMPLVFGGAPVVNTLVTAWMTGAFKQTKPIFYLAIAVVALGAAGVLATKPRSGPHGTTVKVDGDSITIVHVDEGRTVNYESAEDLEIGSADELAYHDYLAGEQAKKNAPPISPLAFLIVPLAIGMTALCWGTYGSVLHKGQALMEGSRLRPFLCVGLAYFAIAVIPPTLYLAFIGENGAWTFGGTSWSLLGGTAGAVGALGIILAFNFGGKPIFVMPLVFGIAPVVNTFATILPALIAGEPLDLNPLFFLSLGMVALGAVAVLYFAPRPTKPKPQPTDEETPAAAADGNASDTIEDRAEPAGGTPSSAKQMFEEKLSERRP